MVQYTLAEHPEILLKVPGKNSSATRNKAMDQLIALVESGKVSKDLPEGLSPQQFVEVEDNQVPLPIMTSDSDTASQNTEDAITQAVQLLSNLATLKLKVQASRTEAMKVRAQVDSLFSDDPVDEAELEQLKEGFKVLKTFAQNNLRYREARAQAEQARSILDQALSLPEATSKSEKKG